MSDLVYPALYSLAFSAGTATFFAPCALPLLPGYVSYFLADSVSNGKEGTPTQSASVRSSVARPLARAVLVGILVSLGMTLVYVGLGGVIVVVGGHMLSDIAILEVVVGVVLVIAGTAMAAGWKVSRSLVRLPARKRSLGAYVLFGVLYAGAAAGCSAPLFVAVTIKGMSIGPVAGLGIVIAYTLGMSVIMMAVTSASALSGSSFASTLGQYSGTIYRASGVLLVLSGLVQITYYVVGIPDLVPL
mgnify:CR=1 FL=1